MVSQIFQAEKAEVGARADAQKRDLEALGDIAIGNTPQSFTPHSALPRHQRPDQTKQNPSPAPESIASDKTLPKNR